MRIVIIFVGLMCAITGAQAQSNLPIEVQAELLQQQIVTEMRAGERAAALGSIDRYRAFGVPMPPALLFVEAALTEKDDPGRSLAAVEQYLTDAPSTDADRQSALTLYTRVLPVVQQSPEAQATHAQRTEVRRLAAMEQANAKAAAERPAVTHATVYFVREKNSKGTDVDYIVESSTGVVGRLANASWFKEEVLIGSQTFVMRWADEAPSSASRSEWELNLAPGETYYFVGDHTHGFMSSKWPISVKPISSFEFENLKGKMR